MTHSDDEVLDRWRDSSGHIIGTAISEGRVIYERG